MSDLKVREYIEELLKPMHVVQNKIRKSLQHDFVVNFESNEKRLVALE